VDKARVLALRDVLAGTTWVERTSSLGRALRRAPHDRGGLLVVGTPTEDPWHFAAHLDDEARWSHQPNLTPTLIRWSPPPNAPAHLSIGVERLEKVRRNETVFVVAPENPTAPLLERVADARKAGATVFAMDTGDSDLQSIAHESLVVPTSAGEGLVVPEFELVTHLVSAAAGESEELPKSLLGGLRSRLARLLDAVADHD
jgi:hypothetical protein